MRNHPAFVRLIQHIDANVMSLDDLRNATVPQVLRIMYPPDGIRPEGDHLTKELVIRGVKAVFADRRDESQRATFQALLEQAGYTVAEVNKTGALTFEITLESI